MYVTAGAMDMDMDDCRTMKEQFTAEENARPENSGPENE